MFSEHTPTLEVSHTEELQQEENSARRVHQKLAKNITKNSVSRAMGPVFGPFGKNSLPGVLD
jgi:hypothetical protein